MVARPDCVCSSRMNRFLRFWGVGAGCTEKGFDTAKKVQHNMGLCCTNGQREGGRVGHFPQILKVGR